VRVHTEDDCVALDMIANDPVPTDGRMGGEGTIGGTKTVTFTRVREGAPAYWQGGARAGRSVRRTARARSRGPTASAGASRWPASCPSATTRRTGPTNGDRVAGDHIV
jgi:hypothetical protein